MCVCCVQPIWCIKVKVILVGHVDLHANGFLVTRIRVIYMSSIFPLADDRSPGIVFVLLFKICGAILWYYTPASEDR